MLIHRIVVPDSMYSATVNCAWVVFEKLTCCDPCKLRPVTPQKFFKRLLCRRENTALYFNCYLLDKFFLWYCGPTRAIASSYMKFLEHSDEPQSVKPLWTRDQLVAETPT